MWRQLGGPGGGGEPGVGEHPHPAGGCERLGEMIAQVSDLVYHVPAAEHRKHGGHGDGQVVGGRQQHEQHREPGCGHHPGTGPYQGAAAHIVVLQGYF